MKILHLEDNATDAELVRALITGEWPQCAVTCVSSKSTFTGELTGVAFDIILSDFALTSLNGMEALKLAKDLAPDTPFIFLSGTIGEDRAIEAVRREGGKVVGVLAVVDREQGGREKIEEQGVGVVSLMTLCNLGIATAR